MENDVLSKEQDIYLASEMNNQNDFEVKTAQDIPTVIGQKQKPTVRVSEIPELRAENRKVFRMSDGTEQAVFYSETVHAFNNETQTFDDVDNTFVEEEDKKHYISGKNRFIARFSRETENNELFSIENGKYRVTVYAKKTKKNKKAGVMPKLSKKTRWYSDTSQILTFADVENGCDYEYSVTGNGVKENIIVKEKASVYRYPFVFHCEHVIAQLDEQNMRIAFLSDETGEEVFFIPCPFMTDDKGVVSTAVVYELKTAANGDTMLTVTADSDWVNDEHRAFPVVIDPQIQISGSAQMTTYSWNDGNMYSSSLHTVGVVGVNTNIDSVSTICYTEGDSTGENCDCELSSGMSNASVLPLEYWVSGAISSANEEDWYQFTATNTGEYLISTQGYLDTVGYLYDSNGCYITSNDDCNGLNFNITAQLTKGQVYYIKVRAYSIKTGNYSVAVNYQGSDSSVESSTCYMVNRMYMSFNMPTLPRNPRIKKAELKVYQQTSENDCESLPKIGLYYVGGYIRTGISSPYIDSNLIDYATMQFDDGECANTVCYTFDVTTFLDKVAKGEAIYSQFVLKLLDESLESNTNATLYGSSCGATLSPQIVVTYESTYGVNTSYRTHTHELGRFGQGSIDLQCGNLMFESEDFAWAGNRMPVTVMHLYNSALYAYQYTSNSAIELPTANFSAMKLGYGFKLNVMQSIMPTTFQKDGTQYSGYVYIGENGEETYFKEGTKQKYDSCNNVYYLFEEVNDGDMVYDPVLYTLTQGEDVYQFDSSGRLISVTDEYKNVMKITYTSNRITSVTDGAGRDFSFAYNSSGYLTSITAPDGTSIVYTYSGNLLNTITYPDGRKTKITYSSNKPTAVILIDANGNNVYKVAYTYSGNKVYTATEYGVENGAFVMGAKSTYFYSVSSGRTTVQTSEVADEGEDECCENVINTVYTFDDDGNVISEYVYSQDVGNVGAEGEESGINPHSGDNGAGVVSNINNLIMNHSFSSLDNWSELECNETGFHMRKISSQTSTNYGKNYLQIFSYNADCMENGVYQTTNTLPAGQYTFSAYMRTYIAFTGNNNPGAYLRVTALDGTVLAESEHIVERNSEYIRLIAPFELAYSQKVRIQFMLNGKGRAYVNAPQLENNPYANSYNMLENGNFELNSGWSCTEGVSYTSGTRFNMSRSLMFNGNVDWNRYAHQLVTVKTGRSTRETFTLSGWAKGYGLPTQNHEGACKPTFRLRAVVYYDDSYYNDQSSETFTADFSPCTEEWQFVSLQFSKSKYRIVRGIRVYLDYNHNFGTAYFDDIQLVRNSIENGLSAEDFETEPEDDTTETTEAEAEVEATEEAGFEELVDAFGNTLTETTFTDGEFGTIYRSFGFNVDSDGSGNAGNDLVSETDVRGNKTQYTVDEDASRNDEIIDRCGNKTAYEYDASGKTTKVTSYAQLKDSDGNTMLDNNCNIQYNELSNVSYAYDTFDNMTEIVRGDGLKYVLKYNAFHNLESIGIDGKTDGDLIKYTYKTGNGRLKEMTYANGDTMKATYNGIGQMVAEKWYNSSDELTAHYKYVYDGQGNIVRSIDILSKKEYTYLYENGKVVQSAESDITLDDNGFVVGKTFVCIVRYYYDAEDKLTKKYIKFADGNEQTVNYEQAENESQIVRFTAGGNTITSHSKSDNFGRKVFDELQLGAGFLSRQFHYLEGEFTDEHKNNDMLKSTPTTQLVSQIVLSGGRTISYEYDEEERITKVTDSLEGVTEYTYDALGQLLTETKNGQTVNQMFYDNYGNILQKNGIQYVYDEVWEDKLISYNGQPITYDAQGNPVNYLGHTLTWEKGRQLKKFVKSDGKVINYTYNANGIRTSKTVDGIRHDYILDGAKIVRETWGNNTLVPLYDNEDSVCGIIYNEVPYYFLKNQQGDIIAITGNTGKDVARYSYDAWGVCTVTQDNSGCDIANINPFRYRGYYCDKEIGMYYLQSRYYDPTVGRFMNGDEVEIAVMQQGTVKHNLFAYCENDCVNDCDIIGLVSLKSVLSALVPKLISAAKMLGEYLLKTFGMSKNKYAHKKKYNNATKLMSFVNENKTKLKRATGVFGKISFALECISIVLEFYPKMNRNFSRSSFFQIAELLFYGLNIALQQLFSKAVAWIISKIAWMLWWAKFLIETALNYILEIVFKKYVSKATSYFANYLDKNKLTIASCFVALFKSFKRCF